ncbi:hypothetical protein HMF7854_04310 [Sphingomonas ginkgonis]|uniref:DUF4258 domain-containing protein n=1 Tax=Sphingomonas ginkgonis TaxID=2315330 RepID=A0A3R9WRK9_9SPHN|nr:hypothetical protein [Sphingomonas ginkgonis]RST30133.1 hypothetical protein HMF7854_04310 [Sphingomonas ginkgonis]
MTVVVTHHAIDRYLERVAPVSRLEAQAAMEAAARGIEASAAIGAYVVRLASGARLICRGRERIRVVTVIPAGEIVGGRVAVLPALRARRGWPQGRALQ